MTEDTKLCSWCKEIKPRNQFGTKKNGRPNSWCKSCVNKKAHEWYKSKNPNAVPAKDRVLILGIKRDHSDYDRLYNLFVNHKLTPVKLEELLAKQNHRCPICSIEFSETVKFYVDHNHSCCDGPYGCESCIRGLLCNSCNVGIGHLKENVPSLLAAIQYLQTDPFYERRR